MSAATLSYRTDFPAPDVAVIHLDGKLRGNEESWAFLDAGRELARERPHVVLDLTTLEHLDSSGVGILASLYTSVTNANGHLVLAGMNSRVTKILDVMWFLRILDHAPDLDGAMAKVEATRATRAAADD